MENFHSKNIDESLQELQSSRDGLKSSVIEENRQKFGRNILEEKPVKFKTLRRIGKSLLDVFIIILLIVAAISLIFGIVNSSLSEILDSAIILFVIVINTTIGIIQQNKSDKAILKLKDMTRPVAKVIRDGKIRKINTDQIVVGDIVVLEAGDVVPADLRLIESHSLKIQEASLTGESEPIEKDAEAVLDEKRPLADRINMAYTSGVVAYGRGMGVVVAVGKNTEVGKIANMISSTKQEKTPLQKRLDRTGKIISVVILILSLIIFIVRVATGKAVLDSFMLAVAVAVCVIPEGLPATVTMVSAISMQNMSKRKSIVRNLSAVETLGSTQVIASDKTGTLTQNKMTVQKIFMLSQQNKNFEACDDFVQLSRCMILCNDTKLKRVDNMTITMGDPTETALIEYGLGLNLNKNKLDSEFKRVSEIPFDSVRKLMTTINDIDGQLIAYTKGAVDVLLDRCSKVLIDGQEVELSSDLKKKILAANKKFGKEALRVLGFAYKKVSAKKAERLTSKIIESEEVFIGLVGMIDPPRKEVAHAVKVCKQAGIKTVMITGDNAITALAVAKEIGIASEAREVLTGKQIDEMEFDKLVSDIHKYKVFARVSPENKVKIVKALKANNLVVAMTGDGVNDAPSIKIADIGIGMGITGTDITKEVADIVLTDDNFATIVDAVEEGRRSYSNIMKVVEFLFSTSLCEMIIMMIILVILDKPFFSPALILWINFVSDTFPGLAYSGEKAEPDVMTRKPYAHKKSIFQGRVGINIIVYSIFQAAILFGAYFTSIYALHLSDVAATTICFVVICLMEQFHALNLRSETQSLFKLHLHTNLWMLGAIALSALLTILIVAIPADWIATLFRITNLSAVQILIAVGFAFAIIPIAEIYKCFLRLFDRKHRKKLQEEEKSEER